MEKLGKVLLFILNIFINLFLISVFSVLALWIVWDVPPQKSVQTSFLWVEEKWSAFTGVEPKERTESFSRKYQRRAYRHLYIQKEKKNSQKDQLIQPYKYE